MKFQLVINMERMSANADMEDVAQHTLEMVQMADAAGFESVWAAEHHALEMTIAPNPFQILTWWAAHTCRIRLGVAVVVAPYWHPIDVAGEASLLDLYSGGRLEFGIGSGAYQREFDRIRPGIKQSDGYKYTQEMLPAVKALWAGDYAHQGEFWSFPTATSVPKPARPIFATMRYTAVVEHLGQIDAAVTSVCRQLGQFENLYKNLGGVTNGFPDEIDLSSLSSRKEFNPDELVKNLMFGTPDQVIDKLRQYEEIGVDQFTYCASFGLSQSAQKRSLELFIDEVMPEFD